MARPRTDFRNEMKTRFTDEQFSVIKKYQADNKLSSEAEALRDLVVFGACGLLGMSGTMPESLMSFRPEMAQSGPLTRV